MEEQLCAARAQLRDILSKHPGWTQQQLAEAVGYSVSWVKKWRKRLSQALAGDESVLWSHSRAYRTPYPHLSESVVKAILDIRDHPPGNLKRVPGPLAILYYLGQDEGLKASGEVLPRSTRTVWKVLDEHQRIWRQTPVEHTPWELPPPGGTWQGDMTDVTTVPPDPEGKKQHAVESLNIIDVGTSILIDAQVRADFNAQTVLETLAGIFVRHGLPQRMTLDRDTRFVGSAAGSDFPAALIRFLMTLGVEVDICPPRRPDLKGFVERFNGTYASECLRAYCPTDLAQAEEVTAAFREHYNHERPNQAKSCGNRPPCLAFDHLPAQPTVPEWVDPDLWLQMVHGQRFTRKVRADGCVLVDRRRYYVSAQLAGQRVALIVDGFERKFIVLHQRSVFKHIPIKGLFNGTMTFDDYVKKMSQEAYSEYRRWLSQRIR